MAYDPYNINGILPATGNAVPGGLSPVTGLSPEFVSRIQTMMADMPPELRSRFNIISGYRSAERQAQVNPSVKHSLHTAGFAADTTRDPGVLAWINQHGPKYGVGFTLHGHPGEENHLEMLGARDKLLAKASLGSDVAGAVENQYPTKSVSASGGMGIAKSNMPDEGGPDYGGGSDPVQAPTAAAPRLDDTDLGLLALARKSGGGFGLDPSVLTPQPAPVEPPRQPIFYPSPILSRLR